MTVSEIGLPSPNHHHSTTEESSMVNYPTSSFRSSPVSTIIAIPPDVSPVVSSILSPARKKPEFDAVPHRKSMATKPITLSYLKHRLCIRERFLARLTLVSNMMTFLGIFGIVLMIIENEITFSYADNKDTTATWFIKLFITLSTAILIALIFYYHHLDMTLYAYRNRLDGWYVALTFTKVLKITVEILICIVHPMPRSYPHVDPPKIEPISYSMSYVSIDVVLGLPMFLRLYLLGRSIMTHSTMVRTIPLRSVAYLNHVSVTSYFLIKTFLKKWPARTLVAFSTVVFLLGSWSLRACDYKPTGEHMSMLDSMWLFIITSTTVGKVDDFIKLPRYGDLTPTTYCGRSVATIISLFGLLLSALLIAILTQKLQLTREEKYVHTFITDTVLKRTFKEEAANVIKFAMKSWWLKHHQKSHSILYFHIQRKLFRSILVFQKNKKQKNLLVDSCVGFTEVITAQRTSNAQSEKTAAQIMTIQTDMKSMREELANLSHNMNILQNALFNLIDKLPKKRQIYVQ